MIMTKRTGLDAPATAFAAHDRVAGRVRLRARALKARAALGPLLEASLRDRPGVRGALPNVDVTVHAEPFEEEIHHQRE